MYKITLVKSLIGRKPNQGKTLKALGLTKVNQVVTKPDNDAVRGAGVLVSGNNTTIDNSTFTGNNAIDGAGALIRGDDANITDSTFTGNNATSGAGLLVNGTDTNIYNSNFTDNNAFNGAGALIDGNKEWFMELTKN